MTKFRMTGGALVVASLVVATATTATSSVNANLTCASQVVAQWSVARLANETIAVTINAENIGAMGPAARAGYGGILLLGSAAPAHFAGVVATLQRETPDKYEMLVMTDDEGGAVRRLTNVLVTAPWAQTMGKNLTPAQITAEGKKVGLSLASAGVNTDLAPVLDVDGRAVYPGATNPDGYRSFGGVPTNVASDGVAFLNGLREAGVTAVVKHFPGLGGSTGNTDYGPAATVPWATLNKTGLVPFAAAVRDGATAVMVSNATVPGLSTLPSSISPVVMQVLRQQLGFGGLIMTDALGAGALSAIHLGVPAASVRALQAGADLTLESTPPSPAASLRTAQLTSNAIQRAVSDGALSLATLQGAAAQVLASRNQVSCPGVAVTTTTT
ncbi:MAG TPA: glycoside hydrolase family 3 N-terminal domain-containing protein [Acidimicrobiales bacterium]|nr:glycoside hydrolase family 3 N-terminal domain-containing protein [Acidimicrobiales bacterium]